MRAVVMYESLTGNTERASHEIARRIVAAGGGASVCNVQAIDYAALSTADVVFVGTWTDGLFVVGQRPGRAGRLKKLPVLDRKKAVVFCTFALDAGKVLEKMQRILEERGAEVVGGMSIRRDRIPEGAAELVERTLGALSTA